MLIQRELKFETRWLHGRGVGVAMPARICCNSNSHSWRRSHPVAEVGACSVMVVKWWWCWLLALAFSINRTFFVWLLWPSRISSTFEARWVGCTTLMKWSTQHSKSSALIHPLFASYPTVPGGDPSSSSGFIRTRGKIIIGGTYDPVAETQATTVTFFPLSALVIAPMPFFPFWASTFPGLWHMVYPDSSKLKMFPSSLTRLPVSSKMVVCSSCIYRSTCARLK